MNSDLLEEMSLVKNFRIKTSNSPNQSTLTKDIATQDSSKKLQMKSKLIDSLAKEDEMIIRKQSNK